VVGTRVSPRPLAVSVTVTRSGALEALLASLLAEIDVVASIGRLDTTHAERPASLEEEARVTLDSVALSHIESIFEVTDRMGIHRESLVIPLGTRSPGSVRRTPKGKLEIVVDREVPFLDFVASLEERIRALP
jgi:hypothetical protein